MSDVPPERRLHSLLLRRIGIGLLILVVCDNLSRTSRSEMLSTISQGTVLPKRVEADDVLKSLHNYSLSSDVKMLHNNSASMSATGNIKFSTLGSKDTSFQLPAGIDTQVKVEIYLESQDRATQVLTEWVLVPVVGGADMDMILDLTVYAWGKANLLRPDGSISSTNINVDYVLSEYKAPKFMCEHGPTECEGNAWISCLQDKYPDIHRWFRVFSCMETLTCTGAEAPVQDAVVGTGSAAKQPCRGSPGEVIDECLSEYGADMDVDILRNCVSGARGSRLLLENMVKTASLNPPMDHVPWFVVEGKVLNYPNRTDAFLLGKAVCDAYAEKVRRQMNLATNATVELPGGCYFFPEAPPYFEFVPVNQMGIHILWIVGSVLFGVGVTLLGCWKYHNSKEP